MGTPKAPPAGRDALAGHPQGAGPTPPACACTSFATAPARASAASWLSASAYTLTTSSVPEGRTNARPLGTGATAASMAACRPAGLAQRVSASVVVMTVRSATCRRRAGRQRVAHAAAKDDDNRSFEKQVCRRGDVSRPQLPGVACSAP